MGSFDVLLDDERAQLDAFLEDYRRAVELTLEGLTEEESRRRLVPSATTLLGLLKHATWMQRVWFEACVGGVSREALGLAQSVDESFQLSGDDTIASVLAAHRDACTRARAVVADIPLDTIVTGHQAGPRTLRWVMLQVLRELAHHCGHADILREQILAARG
ncbi:MULTISPECIES: DinB family protein [Mycolicibacterium]|uniref:DinB family protein n=1 Tax=Mycobacteriaceae TaxID=1762 RepID=UPI00076A9660|nr:MULTISPECIES: DinB family protein [Mycolicibacterium]UCZ58043.1 DinB family protein [Mycolicibacterium phocaicum]GCA98424.1 hypothetical protein NCCNTM_20590 [Mycolicibacterium sp. NCC-Tsukiji]